jgi:single-stranded-DNA-specific exonuclease
VDKFNDFIDLSLNKLHNPMLLPDIKPVVNRIIKALENKEKIFVHGDYDVDGITSTAVVIYTLRKLGADINYHVPHRICDGYDIKEPSVDRAIRAGASLLISVDCGILAFKAAEHAKEKGIDLIITDHHTPKDDGSVPDCIGVVNPARLDSQYPFKGLAGVGIAFKVMCVLAAKYKIISQREMIDFLGEFVALGTVADVAPMIDENRILVSFGCKKLTKSDKVGVQALLKVAGIKSVDTTSIGFQIGPRINAVGRLDDPKHALDLLLTTSETNAKRLANMLDTANKERQKLLQQNLEEAYSLIPTDEEELAKHKIMVLSAANWHPGLVGLIAGKVAEKYGRPAMICAILPEGIAKGSCRSTRTFHILNAMKSEHVSPLFTKFGGHAFAAGFELPHSKLDLMRTNIINFAQDKLGEEHVACKTVYIDANVYFGEITNQLYEDILKLAPFGAQHETPVFMTKAVKISKISTVGTDGQHLKLRLTNQRNMTFVNAVWWRHGELAKTLKEGDTIDIAYTLSRESYQGYENLSLVLEDIKILEQ